MVVGLSRATIGLAVGPGPVRPPRAPVPLAREEGAPCRADRARAPTPVVHTIPEAGPGRDPDLEIGKLRTWCQRREKYYLNYSFTV